MISVFGDLHGEFDYYNEICKNNNIDVALVCGDVAQFWAGKKYEINPHAYTYYCAGNHEDWNMLEELGRVGLKPIETEDKVFYCPTGSEVYLNDKKVVFIGGAFSIDYIYREEGVSWFKNELVSKEDIDFVLEHHKSADIIISHTCPTKFLNKGDNYHFHDDKYKDPSREQLDKVLNELKPSYWFYGHWHRSISGKENNTEWRCLNYINNDDMERPFIDISNLIEVK